MKHTVTLVSLALLCPLISGIAGTAPSNLIEAKVSDEVRAILPEYQFVDGEPDWESHGIAHDGLHITYGSSFCVFQEPSPNPVVAGLELTRRVLEGFQRHYHLDGFIHSFTSAREGVPEAAFSAGSSFEWTGDSTQSGRKSCIVMSARFVHISDHNFGIVLHYTYSE